MNKCKIGIICLLLAIIIGVLPFAGCSDCGGGGNTLDPVINSGEIKIGVDGISKPMSFYGDSGSLEGLSVDIGKEIAKRLGVKAVFVQVPKEQCIEALNSGKIDIYINLAAPGREVTSQVLKLETGLESRQVFVVKSSSSINRLFDLKGKYVGVVSGTDAADALAAASQLHASLKKVVSTSDMEDLIELFDTDNLHAIAVDEALFRSHVIGSIDNYRILSDPLSSADYIFAVRNNDSTFHKRIGELYDAMNSDGSIASLKAKWMG